MGGKGREGARAVATENWQPGGQMQPGPKLPGKRREGGPLSTLAFLLYCSQITASVSILPCPCRSQRAETRRCRYRGLLSGAQSKVNLKGSK